MPIYDYQCKDCSTLYDVYHKTKEIVEDIVCPHCGSKSYLKLISVPSIAMVQEGSTRTSNMPSCTTGCCGGTCDLE